MAIEKPLKSVRDRAGRMKIDRFKALVFNLGNKGWCRHWFDYNLTGMLAVQVFDFEGNPARYPALEHMGFVHIGRHVYLINRELEPDVASGQNKVNTEEDGQKGKAHWPLIA